LTKKLNTLFTYFFKVDGFVKSLFCPIFGIPAKKAGTQLNQMVLSA